MTLGILLPTRGRPDNLDRFLRAVKDSAGDSHVYLRLDNDDPEAPMYDKVLNLHGDNNVSVYHGDRVGFGPSLNELAAHAEGHGISHLGMFGDDVVPMSLDWDLGLVAALNNRLGVSFGDDGLRKKHAPDLPTHYVTQTEVYRRLGYLSPPGFKHLFLDNVARDIGRALKNFVFVPVRIRHMHPWAEGEHLHDTTYAEGGRNPEIRKADAAAYSRWASKHREWKRALGV